MQAEDPARWQALSSSQREREVMAAKGISEEEYKARYQDLLTRSFDTENPVQTDEVELAYEEMQITKNERDALLRLEGSLTQEQREQSSEQLRMVEQGLSGIYAPEGSEKYVEKAKERFLSAIVRLDPQSETYGEEVKQVAQDVFVDAIEEGYRQLEIAQEEPQALRFFASAGVADFDDGMAVEGADMSESTEGGAGFVLSNAEKVGELVRLWEKDELTESGIIEAFEAGSIDKQERALLEKMLDRSAETASLLQISRRALDAKNPANSPKYSHYSAEVRGKLQRIYDEQIAAYNAHLLQNMSLEGVDMGMIGKGIDDAFAEVLKKPPVGRRNSGQIMIPGVESKMPLGGRFDDWRKYRNGQHYGVDYATGREGPDIIFPNMGVDLKVIHVGIDGLKSQSAGNYVRLEGVLPDGQKLWMQISHMQDGSVSLKKGATIKPGDLIGKVGNTGQSDGPHMDLKIKINGKYVDPDIVLPTLITDH